MATHVADTTPDVDPDHGIAQHWKGGNIHEPA